MFAFKWLHKLIRHYDRQINEELFQSDLRCFERIERHNQQIYEYLEQNDRVISVKRTELRPCYDSTWEVRILLDNRVVEGKIVRVDSETPLNLAVELLNVDSIEALKALDERDKIYYD
jgi:hypothetical protein